VSTSKDRASCFIDDARNRFLNAIRKHDRARDALVDLAGAPLEAFLASSPLDPSRKWQLVSITNSNLLPDLMPLRDAISAWMKRWNLDAPWIGDTALETLRGWKIVPSLHERLEWSWIGSGWMEPEPMEGPTPWTPHGDESSRDARNRLDSWYDAQRKALSRQEQEARASGLPVGHGRHQTQAIDWAIRFQLLREPVSKIASEETKDVKTVRKAIHGFLEFIDLPLRPTAAGRPRGSHSHAGLGP
jgi:hypothetical protein